MSNKGNFGNKRKDKQLKALSNQVLPTKQLIDSCAFNFYFLTENPDVEASTLQYWTDQGFFVKHLSKFKQFSKESLKTLQSSHHYQGMYKWLRDKRAQPSSATLHMPEQIPTCAKWYEFHLGGKQRLVGFVMPGEYHGEKFPDVDSEYTISKNVFYVVFFDGEHKFWPSKLKNT